MDPLTNLTAEMLAQVTKETEELEAELKESRKELQSLMDEHTALYAELSKTHIKMPSGLVCVDSIFHENEQMINLLKTVVHRVPPEASFQPQVIAEIPLKYCGRDEYTMKSNAELETYLAELNETLKTTKQDIMETVKTMEASDQEFEKDYKAVQADIKALKICQLMMENEKNDLLSGKDPLTSFQTSDRGDINQIVKKISEL